VSYHEIGELDSPVNIVDRLRAGQARNQGPISGRRHFSLHRARSVFGAHPAPHPVDKGSSFSGVKWAGSDADYSLPSIAEG
jgi:hypothetical protein